MANAANRAAGNDRAFAREAERLKETSQAASAVLATLSASIRMRARAPRP